MTSERRFAREELLGSRHRHPNLNPAHSAACFGHTPRQTADRWTGAGFSVGGAEGTSRIANLPTGHRGAAQHGRQQQQYGTEVRKQDWGPQGHEQTPAGLCSRTDETLGVGIWTWVASLNTQQQ
ncbi:hypothetical protein SKAU_G00283410 [Synaphobranchus kaupii]|uniref:Uncharacterized protein n=1 Tax=Synaphobranchus kaupii TaxID=118154 RepID=A0A9Q1EXK6_SYNKA|nr:hypothetical protein SKAU_G00283410 [Synaphobranchus kaupii]